MSAKVKVIANENGSVINQSTSNPEYGYVKIVQVRTLFDDNGFLRAKPVNALIQGRIEELEYKSGKILFNVYNCFECSHLPDMGRTVCKLDEGFLSKICSERLKSQYLATELECFATGSSATIIIEERLSSILSPE